MSETSTKLLTQKSSGKSWRCRILGQVDWLKLLERRDGRVFCEEKLQPWIKGLAKNIQKKKKNHANNKHKKISALSYRLVIHPSHVQGPFVRLHKNLLSKGRGIFLWTRSFSWEVNMVYKVAHTTVVMSIWYSNTNPTTNVMGHPPGSPVSHRPLNIPPW